jgi:hypothetical protein
VWFAWGAENDEIEVPKKSAETGGHLIKNPQASKICTVITKSFATPFLDWFIIMMSSRYIISLIPGLCKKATTGFNILVNVHEANESQSIKTKKLITFPPPPKLTKFLVVWVE